MKRVLSLLLSIIMMVSCVGSIQFSANAGDYTTTAVDLTLTGQWSGDYWNYKDDGEQWYHISIPSDGVLNIMLMSFKSPTYSEKKVYGSYGTYLELYTYDLSKKILTINADGTESSPQTVSDKSVLSAGDYYLKSYGKVGKYRINCAYESYNTTDIDAKRADSSQLLLANNTVIGAITPTDEEDWYSFQVDYNGYYTLKLISYKSATYSEKKVYGSYGTYLDLYNYDLSSKILTLKADGSESSPQAIIENVVLSSGTYYIKMTGNNGKYLLSWYSLTPDNCSHEFISSTLSPTFLSKGYTKHTCNICGYSYTDNYTAKLKVNVPSVSSLKKGKKKITVYISNAYNIDGIQISYSTSKKFTKSKTKKVSTKKTTKTLTKLSNKKKYYVKVRGYKIIDGKKVYSSWSKVKSVKTK